MNSLLSCLLSYLTYLGCLHLNISFQDQYLPNDSASSKVLGGSISEVSGRVRDGKPLKITNKPNIIKDPVRVNSCIKWI